MNVLKTIIFILPFILSLFLARDGNSIWIDNDTILVLYEGNTKVENSTYFTRIYSESPSCYQGSCNLGRNEEMISVTVYKSREPEVLNYSSWEEKWYLSNSGCEGFVTKADDLMRASSDWTWSEEYRKTSDLAYREPIKEERERLWEELRPMEEKFMRSKGFDFLYDPKCNPNLKQMYQTDYLNNIYNNVEYSQEFNLPPFPDYDEEACKSRPDAVGHSREINVNVLTGEVISQKVVCYESDNSKITTFIGNIVEDLIQSIFGLFWN